MKRTKARVTSALCAMQRLLKEPLLHFLLMGTGLFLAYGLVSKHASDDPGKIVISQGQIGSMVESFARTWQRLPTKGELDGLVRDRVRDEVYFREAVALGLDRDDTVIRRRLRQKMEFISDDIAAQVESTDAELNDYLQAHLDSFRVDQRLTFRQVYLNPEKRGEKLTQDAAQLLEQLNHGGSQVDAAVLGDSLLLEHEFAGMPAREITKQFGQEFTTKLTELPSGQWLGPLESGYGLHLVYISERTEGRAPVLAEVRDAVRREWANARRLEANEKFFQAILSRYAVVIEGPGRERNSDLAANIVK